MTDKVVDASAVVALLFDELTRDEVARRLSGFSPRAPDLIRFEVASACLKKIRAGPGSSRRCWTRFHCSTIFRFRRTLSISARRSIWRELTRLSLLRRQLSLARPRARGRARHAGRQACPRRRSAARSVISEAGARTEHPSRRCLRRGLPHSGMLSCFFQGFSSFLLRSMASTRDRRRRVECGMITSSI